MDKVYDKGDFSFMDSMSANILESPWSLITDDEWEFLSTYSPKKGEGFMFTPDDKKPEILKSIERKVIENYSGHSGASFGWAMRQYEYIAKNGWNKFVHTHIQNKKA